jgi:hypothetical protein
MTRPLYLSLFTLLLAGTTFLLIATSDKTIHRELTIEQALQLTGTWNGTSLCQVPSSPCNDEVVVYHITQGKHDGEYSIVANKVVSGKEEYMGTIPFTYDTKTNKLIGIMKGYPAWIFTVTGNVIDGTLLLEDGTLYRRIHVVKA